MILVDVLSTRMSEISAGGRNNNNNNKCNNNNFLTLLNFQQHRMEMVGIFRFLLEYIYV